MRQFDSGATRDTDNGKLDYEGFLSPYVLERFAQYMHDNRIQKDGTLRASDNWQKGIPREAYMKSGWRHFHEWWTIHRDGLRGMSLEPWVLEEALCALLFNVQGYLHELLVERLHEGPRVATPSLDSPDGWTRDNVEQQAVIRMGYCPAELYGYVCCCAPGHPGPHVAYGTYPLLIWSDDWSKRLL